MGVWNVSWNLNYEFDFKTTPPSFGEPVPMLLASGGWGRLPASGGWGRLLASAFRELAQY
ncbi:MAG: hypothetical protein R6V37_01435 [Psychroflexus maritimus]